MHMMYNIESGKVANTMLFVRMRIPSKLKDFSEMLELLLGNNYHISTSNLQWKDIQRITPFLFIKTSPTQYEKLIRFTQPLDSLILKLKSMQLISNAYTMVGRQEIVDIPGKSLDRRAFLQKENSLLGESKNMNQL
ncbi:unnamed protein product (macronuclear) [Paramecium tetraurelia]|uniref:Uncharacterized protein n=1 Tax=Paramecium tetraurelia TaxID=5888 RepID=A0DII3_PARTE|nr:uncharacterized protein GSPATT00039514001 [Paramecium tetraurelia]CAK82850.1 unnamed protein product [Paramecium tetraurelia]|eukprot:XP_001450247.1 hypothetical protein (macronuclear) [Paramecium tetraurelia strain d4-2]